MLGVTMADVVTKIACLEEVDTDTLKAGIEENEIKAEYAPYYVLVYYLIQSDVVDSYDNFYQLNNKFCLASHTIIMMFFKIITHITISTIKLVS